MNNRYYMESHLLHSGLQLIWKRLNATRQMDAGQILRHNKELFDQVSQGIWRRFGITCTDLHAKEASQMLYHALQANIPRNYWVIVRRTSGLDEYNITLDESGNIVTADSNNEWTEEEAHSMLSAISERYPKEQMWIEDRIPRYVTRIRFGD